MRLVYFWVVFLPILLRFGSLSHEKARESVLFSMISVSWGTDIYNICKANISCGVSRITSRSDII